VTKAERRLAAAKKAGVDGCDSGEAHGRTRRPPRRGRRDRSLRRRALRRAS
jgi:hypothetical protein